MDDANMHGDNVSLSGYLAVTEGCFGIINWNVCSGLYDRLPRDKRNALLDATAVTVIQPFGQSLTERLLSQAGCTATPINTLDASWSFQTRQTSCVFGRVDWQISQGLWDAIPEDQQEALYDMSVETLHNFFGENVYVPLMRFAYREFGGPR